MATAPVEPLPSLDRDPVAPWWHTVLFLAFLLVVAVLDAKKLHGNQAQHMNRMFLYISSIVMEFAMVGYVWLFGLRLRGKHMRDIIGGKWNTFRDFLRDLGAAVVFWGVVLMTLVMTNLALRQNPSAIEAVRRLVPHTGAEMVTWVLVAASAGFCEEFLFRGYLQRQFFALTGKTGAAVALQALVFGAAHLYQGWKGVVTITVYGVLFGGLATMRKSLRPGMMQHAAQDTFTGLLFSVLDKHGRLPG